MILHRQRSTQNKFKKETELDEVRSLRSENQKLRKANKRLQKELNKFLFKETDLIEDDEPIRLTLKEVCPSCKSENIKTVDLGIKKLMVCKDCSYRKSLVESARID